MTNNEHQQALRMRARSGLLRLRADIDRLHVATTTSGGSDDALRVIHSAMVALSDIEAADEHLETMLSAPSFAPRPAGPESQSDHDVTATMADAMDRHPANGRQQ